MHAGMELNHADKMRGGENRHREHPLGPMVRFRRSTSPMVVRCVALCILAGSLTLLAVAASVTPDASGVGTHRQLGRPECTLLVLTGYPCPTCGMTTAFAHTVRGHWVRALRAQPMGWLLAMGTILVIGPALVSLVLGGVWIVNWYRVSLVRLLYGFVLLSAAAWAYKIVAIRTAAGG